MVSIQFQITFILFDTKIPLLRFYAFKSELLYNTNAHYNFARLHATHQYILPPQKPQNYLRPEKMVSTQCNNLHFSSRKSMK